MLINLLNNAIKFTTSGGVALRVQVIEQENTNYILEFEVEDTGVGIPTVELNRLIHLDGLTELANRRQFDKFLSAQ